MLVTAPAPAISVSAMHPATLGVTDGRVTDVPPVEESNEWAFINALAACPEIS